MRQTGYMAAAAAYALTNNYPLLPRVHALAKKLKGGLEGLGAVITAPVDTCMASGHLHSLLVEHAAYVL